MVIGAPVSLGRRLNDRSEQEIGFRTAGMRHEPAEHGVVGERRHEHADGGLAVGRDRHAYTV
jgi:hypothetical protein